MNGRPTDVSGIDAAESSAPAVQPVFLTRRRIALLVAGFFAMWLVGIFVRQVGDAAAAQNMADQMRVRNAAMARDLASLEAELQLIGQPSVIAEMARGYLLGTPHEVPFTIDPKASPLPVNAPGSVGIQHSGQGPASTPLDAWLQALFGSST
jgi:hypothetical protein